MAKKSFIVRLFDDIAPTYDRLNHLLSLNIDKSWRKKTVRQIQQMQPSNVLDVACGTGDFSIALAQAGVPKVKGVDISEGMMEVARYKIAKAGYSHVVTMKVDDCEALSFADASFDAVSVAFGVRNFEHLQLGLSEMCRVLKPGGKVFILELSVPTNPTLLKCYKLYFLHILPFFGGLISGNKSAYKYLPVSVMNFPKPPVFISMLESAGFHHVTETSMTFGLCRLFVGEK